jgi:hypothetical protein
MRSRQARRPTSRRPTSCRKKRPLLDPGPLGRGGLEPHPPGRLWPKGNLIAGAELSGSPSAPSAFGGACRHACRRLATYHGDAARSGILRDAPLTGFQAAYARQDWETDQLDGDIDASPILANGIVMVATENDTVYAFDTSARGQARLVWKTLKLSSGEVQASRAVDPYRESPGTHQQRAALALANGYVYIPYGGLLGDCGQYHGRVVGVPVNGGDLIQYQTSCDR